MYEMVTFKKSYSVMDFEKVVETLRKGKERFER
jgi:hypothetical protein